MNHEPSRMDRIEAAMKFQPSAHKKFRSSLEELAKRAYELQLQCKNLRLQSEKLLLQTSRSTIKITPSMFLPE